MKNFNEHSCTLIIRFLREEVSKRKAKCVVVGISGGIDSAVVVALAVKALGSGRVFGLVLPDSAVTPRMDIKHAIDLATRLKIRNEVIELDRVRNQLLRRLPRNRLARGNLLVRLRMAIIYYYAAILKGIVLGTGDKSEIILGYFTKYGDGAADLFPIADLYKTQVRSIAKYLAIPDDIINKKSSARLWKGHTAEGEIGLTYEDIDIILDHLARRIPIKNSRLKQKTVKIKQLIEKNKHKHEMPVICKILQ
jgi:NAD+ synthase